MCWVPEFVVLNKVNHAIREFARVFERCSSSQIAIHYYTAASVMALTLPLPRYVSLESLRR
jgi:hypothetical protein